MLPQQLMAGCNPCLSLTGISSDTSLVAIFDFSGGVFNGIACAGLRQL